MEQHVIEDFDDEIEFWRDFLIWWESKYDEPAAPRLLEALNIAEARGLRALSEQVEKSYIKQ